MTHPSTTITCVPSEGVLVHIAAVLSPDGQVQASRPFATRSAAEAFLQAFMQENAGEYGLVHDGTGPQSEK
jgi:hypothetical protein